MSMFRFVAAVSISTVLACIVVALFGTREALLAFCGFCGWLVAAISEAQLMAKDK